MIFKRLFTPSHQSAEPETRLAAVDKLSPDKSQDKAILHELAFNDADADVTLAALRKLDKFALWQKTAQLSRSEKVKRIARQEVEKAVLAEQGRALDTQQRIDYLKESADSDLIRRALVKPVEGLDDSTILQLVAKVGQDNFTLQYYQTQASEHVRKALIQAASDAQLDKFSRKESSDSLIRIIDEQKQMREALKRKPEAVRQALTLLFSKLNALSDKADYAEIKRRLLLLNDEYHQLSNEFSWLDDASRALASDKFKTLSARVDAHLEKLRPAWEEAQQSEQYQALLADAHTASNAAENAVMALYGPDRTSVAMASVEQANSCLEALESAIRQLPQHTGQSHERTSLNENHERLSHLIAVFPAQQHLAQQFEAFLQSADELPVVSQQSLNTLEEEYKAYTLKIAQMPDAWSSAWRDIRKRHKQAIKSAKAADDEKIKSVRRLVSIVGSLISEGRYKAALSRYANLKAQFDALSESEQNRLRRRFDDIQSQVERLEGWQTYLAAPRKPELLAQANMLASQPPDSIKQRAKQIKILREQWQSLTQPGDNSEEAKQFDTALELAFAPCRAHYAEQEEARESARQDRLRLIEEVKELGESQDDVAATAKRYEQLKQAWRNAGQVEKSVYEQLRLRWEDASSSVNKRVLQWHQQNREQKQALINAANALLDMSERQEAAAQAQHLQKEWKQIGHAGPKYENKLWRAFKQANDTLFNAVKSQQADQKEKQRAEAQQYLDKVDTLLSQVTETEPAEAKRLLSEIKADASPFRKSVPRLDKKLKHAEAVLRDARDTEQSRNKKAQYRALIKGLDAWKDFTLPASTQMSDEIWQAMNKQHQAVMLKPITVDNDREWFTTQLELLADCPSPESALAQRQDIQLAMMMDKLESGESYSIEDTLLKWISCGPVTDNDAALYSRFCEVVEHRLINSKPDKGIEQ
ncbi:DUF349 domain-containing protein [Salinimonas sp. HHU 13199]|uniref:DUF349 domain-containing protein n=1 Tax=Salinimonas profundi TaxID=2729140 RepID=A0ABR8LDI5_9ALTE|nr:DUF349 domain-containing protein [Salinimonas profundi]MBD3584365.1 DUF349 domain-containing protein [Salinimonas profundi]